MGSWVRVLIFGSIVAAMITGGVLIWGGLANPVWHAVDATILVLALLAIFVGCLRLEKGLVDSINFDSLKSFVAWMISLGGGVLVVFVLVWAMLKFTGPDANSNIGLPLIVIVGVIVLLIVISLVTFVFSVLGLASNNQALGLPDGSVRSIIALMLLVLFSIVAIFLYNSVAGGPVASLTVPDAQVEGLRTNITVVATVPDTPAGMTKVYYRNSSSPAGQDIAKQLIVLLGTLVTAVASFYFGSNAVASANAAVLAQQNGAAPFVSKITPNPITPNDTDPQNLMLTGRNLGNITKLHLELKGQADIDAQSVSHPNDNTLTAEVKVPKTTTGDDWSVVVVENDQTNSITVGTVTVASLTVTGIDPSSIKPSNTAATLTLTGRNLGKISKVHLEREGQNNIDGTELSHPDGNTVKAKVPVDDKTATGVWNVVVEDDQKTTTTVGKVTIG